MTGNWGPSHNPAAPVQLGKTGGYWWGIAAGAVVSAPYLMRGVVAGQPDWLLIAVMALAAGGVGVGEARHRKAFASRRWVLFTVAALASVAAAWGLPTLAYVVGFYGWPRWVGARQRRKGTGDSAPRRAIRAIKGRGDAAPPPRYRLPASAGGYFGVDDCGRSVLASPRGAALVIGPPGSGKTQSVIMPSVAFAPSACVSTSMKAEVLAATATARQQRGRVWLFDPGGGPPPAGIIALRWNSRSNGYSIV